MQIILEIIGEIIVQVIFSLPGALIRWLLTGCKKPFREILYDDSYSNNAIGVIAAVICIALTTWILRK